MSKTVITSPPAVARRTARRPLLRRHRDTAWAYALLSPMFVGLSVFYFWPVLQTFYYSFSEWGVFGGHTFTGLDNYREVLESGEIHRALLNTLIYCAIVLLSIPIALVLAVLLNHRGLRGVAVYRTVYFLPVVTAPVAIALLWKYLLNGDFGPVNNVLAWFGAEGTSWLSNPSTALVALSVVGLWATLGYPIVLFLAALQAVPPELEEAAQLDGAGPVRRFVSITVPLISPSIFFVTVLTVIGALQMFDLVYVMVGKTNPAIMQTETIIYLFYRIGFIENDKGLASALVFCLMLVIMALTALQFRLQRRWVHHA